MICMIHYSTSSTCFLAWICPIRQTLYNLSQTAGEGLDHLSTAIFFSFFKGYWAEWSLGSEKKTPICQKCLPSKAKSAVRHTRYVLYRGTAHPHTDKYTKKQTHGVAHLGAKNLGVGLLQQLLLEGLLRVQPEALPRPSPSRSTAPLLRARPRDGADQQRLHADAGVVHLAGRRKRGRWGGGRRGGGGARLEGAGSMARANHRGGSIYCCIVCHHKREPEMQ